MSRNVLLSGNMVEVPGEFLDAQSHRGQWTTPKLALCLGEHPFKIPASQFLQLLTCSTAQVKWSKMAFKQVLCTRHRHSFVVLDLTHESQQEITSCDVNRERAPMRRPLSQASSVRSATVYRRTFPKAACKLHLKAQPLRSCYCSRRGLENALYADCFSAQMHAYIKPTLNRHPRYPRVPAVGITQRSACRIRKGFVIVYTFFNFLACAAVPGDSYTGAGVC